MLRFHELPPSPNNLKIRLALRAKGIPFEVEEVDPFLRGNGRSLQRRSGEVPAPGPWPRALVCPAGVSLLTG